MQFDPAAAAAGDRRDGRHRRRLVVVVARVRRWRAVVGAGTGTGDGRARHRDRRRPCDHRRNQRGPAGGRRRALRRRHDEQHGRPRLRQRRATTRRRACRHRRAGRRVPRRPFLADPLRLPGPPRAALDDRPRRARDGGLRAAPGACPVQPGQPARPPAAGDRRAAPPPVGGGGDDGSYSVIFYFSDGEVRGGCRHRNSPRSTGRPAWSSPTTTRASWAISLVHRARSGRRRWRRVRLRHGRRGADARVLREPTRCSSRPTPTRLVSPYVQDYATGRTAISRLDEGNLVEIADELGVPYLHRSEPGGLERDGHGARRRRPDRQRRFPRDAATACTGSPRSRLLAVLLWQAAVDGQRGDGDATYPRRSGQATPPDRPKLGAATRRWRSSDEEPAA